MWTASKTPEAGTDTGVGPKAREVVTERVVEKRGVRKQQQEREEAEIEIDKLGKESQMVAHRDLWTDATRHARASGGALCHVTPRGQSDPSESFPSPRRY